MRAPSSEKYVPWSKRSTYWVAYSTRILSNSWAPMKVESIWMCSLNTSHVVHSKLTTNSSISMKSVYRRTLSRSYSALNTSTTITSCIATSRLQTFWYGMMAPASLLTSAPARKSLRRDKRRQEVLSARPIGWHQRWWNSPAIIGSLISGVLAVPSTRWSKRCHLGRRQKEMMCSWRWIRSRRPPSHHSTRVASQRSSKTFSMLVFRKSRWCEQTCTNCLGILSSQAKNSHSHLLTKTDCLQFTSIFLRLPTQVPS